MGGVINSIFGGSSKKEQSQSTQESGNKFADKIDGLYTPWAQQGMASSGAGMGQAANILGLNGADASSGALNNWWDSSGGKFMMNQGMDQIIGNRASGGLLRSGGTPKAMENYRSGLASTKLNEYMGNLFNLNSQGIQQALGAGGLVTSAGQYSKGQSTSSGSGSESSGGLGKAIGLGLSLFSDRRLKVDIEAIGEAANGLPWYRFRYVWDTPGTVREGLMSDDVRAFRPEAIVADPSGFDRVNYALAMEAA